MEEARDDLPSRVCLVAELQFVARLHLVWQGCCSWKHTESRCGTRHQSTGC